jgi:hypothetical protein
MYFRNKHLAIYTPDVTTKHILLDSLEYYIEKCPALYSESSNNGLVVLEVLQANR